MLERERETNRIPMGASFAIQDGGGMEERDGPEVKRVGLRV